MDTAETDLSVTNISQIILSTKLYHIYIIFQI